MHRREMRAGAFWLLCAALAPQALAAAEPFSLADVLAVPFASDLAVAPAGGGIAWVLNQRGVRNIWVAVPPDYQGRQLTSYVDDDGQDLSGLSWTPDGRAIVYVRGGGANRAGEVPNPTSDPEGAEQAIFIADLAGGAPRRVGEGSSPAISPQGDRVAFVRKGQVWWAPLAAEAKDAGDGEGKDAGGAGDAKKDAGGAGDAKKDAGGAGDAKEDAAAEPEQLVKARGDASALRWSPDGSRLAFVSDRGNTSYVGVLDLAGKTLRWLDPSVDQDWSPTWSPDGRSLAFLRTPANPKAIPFVPERSGQPWSIRVADVATGESRLVWRAQEERGSVFQGVDMPDQLLWSADDRLVFPWEADGWIHLYSVPLKGGEATLLTPGDFEVEHAALSADRREVFFSSNQAVLEEDVDRKHLWRVAAAGGRPAALTAGPGIEWEPRPTADGKAVALLRSDARLPSRAAVLLLNGSGGASPRDLAPGTIPAAFPADRLVVPRPVVFPAADGLPIRGQLFLPPGESSGGRRPAAIFFHGGSRRQMLLGWHHREYYHNAYALNQYLASRGFVVLSVNYRSGTGYGLEFREAESYGARGASELNDVLGAGLYLRGRPDVDPSRIGLWGGSYGGYLTALGLARASDLFAAGVDFHGVHDWNQVIRNFVPSYNAEARAEIARLAFQSSPMAVLATWRSPVLLIHGDDDRNVPFSETVDLVEALRKQGVELEQLVFPDEVHSFLRHANWLRAYEAAADFLERHLAQPTTAGEGR